MASTLPALPGLSVGFNGVAAGDPTSNGVTLWTRTYDASDISRRTPIAQTVTLQVSNEPSFASLIRQVDGVTSATSQDGTIKFQINGLESGSSYYYRFSGLSGATSMIGRFRTAPSPNQAVAVKIGHSGDVDGLMRPYPVTAGIAAENFDVYIFNGDTIYETASFGSAATPATRDAVAGAISQQTLLEAYRRKYLENLLPAPGGTFPSLQSFFAGQGMVVSFDNHELGNKAMINGGAPALLASTNANGSANLLFDVNLTGTYINDTPTFDTLLQAFDEYLPIRTPELISAPSDPRSDGEKRYYSAQSWGQNALVVNLDTRSFRDVRLNKPTSGDDTGPRADNPNRTLLGATQKAWLKNTLLAAKSADTVWTFINTTDPIDQIGPYGSGADGGKSWFGGYRAERNEILKFIADNGIQNVIFLASDDHQGRINELTYMPDPSQDPSRPANYSRLRGVYSIVDGPMGATGPDSVTDHSFSNIKALADALASAQIAAGLDPIGLDPRTPGLFNVSREGDPTAATNPQAVDFFSPNTNNYVSLDVAANGVLTVALRGSNSYPQNSFPEPTALNAPRTLLQFSLNPNPSTYTFGAASYSASEGSSYGDKTYLQLQVQRSGDLSSSSSVQVSFAAGNATGATAAPAEGRVQGPSSSATPYVLPIAGSGVQIKSILSVGDSIGTATLAGLPEGLGAFDNGDGSFTLLMNHEIGSSSGAVRAHGGRGAFISSWIINKADLSVRSGSDLIRTVYTWNSALQTANSSANNSANGNGISFNRLCSADLAPISAFYNPASGLGSQARIFLNGEEAGSTGYALANLASGPSAGDSYILGKFNLSSNGSGLSGVGGWENLLANPLAQNKTVVIGNNDGGSGLMNGSLVVYQGMKTASGSEVDKAGLTNGAIKFVAVNGFSDRNGSTVDEISNTTSQVTAIASGTRFSLNATAATTFSRPEDGAWDPNNPNHYYFVTSNRLDTVSDGLGSQIGQTRLWRLNFDDIRNPDLGGSIDLLIDGDLVNGQKVNMFDNIAIDRYGHVLLQEDVGNAAHNGKIWHYDIASDSLKLLSKFDPARFGDVGLAATAPFTIDEETSGIIDAQDLLGPGWFLFAAQAHYSIADPKQVEGGQLLALFNPDSYLAGTDYVNTTQTISFAPGEASKTVSVPILADGQDEPNETFVATLVNPGSGGVIGGGQASAQLTIIDQPLYTPGVNTINGVNLGITSRGYALQSATGTPIQVSFSGANASPGNPGNGWTAIAATPLGDGYGLYWQNSGSSQAARWQLNSSGVYTSGTLLSASELTSEEAALALDLNGDGYTSGRATVDAINLGSTSLGYALRNGAATPIQITYPAGNASASNPGNGWSAVVATASGEGYSLYWRHGGSGQTARWQLNAGGAYTAGTFLAASQLIREETNLNLDLNGDGVIAVSISSTPQGYALLGAGPAPIPVVYPGGTASSSNPGNGWSASAVVASDSGYTLYWSNSGIGQAARWSLNGSGVYEAGVMLSASQLFSDEAALNRDLNGDGFVSGNSTINGLNLGTTAQGYALQTGYGPAIQVTWSGGNASANNPGQGWVATAAVASGGGTTLYWHNSATNQNARWQLNASGGYQAGSLLSNDQLYSEEGSLNADLNGDAIIGAGFTTLESQGNASLLRRHDGLAFVEAGGNRYPVRSPFNLGTGDASTEWQMLAAETVGGGHNQILWRHNPDNDLHVWTLDPSWTWQSSSGMINSLSPEALGLETSFQLDLNGNAVIG